MGNSSSRKQKWVQFSESASVRARAVQDPDESSPFLTNDGHRRRSSSVRHRRQHHHSLYQKEKMQQMESLEYKQTDNVPLRQWAKKKNLGKKNIQKTATKWMIIFLLGVILGCLAYLIRTAVEFLSEWKFKTTVFYMRKDEHVVAFLVYYAINMLYVSGAAFAVFIFGNNAAGSGIPEVKGYLNGVRVVATINLKTFIGKITSVILAYSASLPIGPEGPMVHIGAMVGAGISAGKSRTLNFRLLPRIFESLRNDRDQRDFIASGSAAGITAAFGSPIGGVLFALEEASSYWSRELTWRTFFGCMISAFTVNLLSGGFKDSFVNDYGLLTFGVSRFSLYRYEELAFFAILGVIGGALGALFVRLNMFIMRFRRDYIGQSKKARFIELLVISTLAVMLTFGIPTLGRCRPTTDIHYSNDICDNVKANSTHPHDYFCKDETYYNDLANLFFIQEENALRLLFSRTSGMFTFQSLIIFIVVFFFLATITSGTTIASGLFVPMMLIGASFGRIMGESLQHLFKDNNPPIDPSIYALIGSTAMMSGFSRITISLSVIVVELTENTQYLLPIMLSVMIAKWVGDLFSKSIYDELIELKSIPMLEDHPPHGAKLINVPTVMTKDVKCLNHIESVENVVKLLKDSEHVHNGFPVVHQYPDRKDVYLGMISRKHLLILLDRKLFFGKDSTVPGTLEYYDFVTLLTQRSLDLSKIDLPPPDARKQLFIDLRPYMDRSHVVIQTSFSFMEAYRLFKTMGLRHLPVVNFKFCVVGILTRQDFLEFHFGLPEDILYDEEEMHSDEDEEDVEQGLAMPPTNAKKSKKEVDEMDQL